MTRSLHAITHGDLAASLQFHLFGPVVFFGALLFVLFFAAEAISGRKLALQISGRMKKHAAMLFAVVWLVYWGARFITE
jgi:hypothetical protein